MKPIADALAELDSGLSKLIEASLRENTTSHSSLDEIITGNAYQSLRMRDDVRKGFRERDTTLFAGIPMAGKRFVDMGCNLGEKTRLAVLAGAAYAEGIEYEEFFVRIGGLVSIYNRTSSAVIRQGDITQPNCITGEFDIGGCFSAFVYVQRNLAEILGRIKQMFMLETHQLADGWYGGYVRPIEPFMPFWTLHGFTDHGKGHAGSWRGLMLFAREAAPIMDVMRARLETLPAGHRDLRTLAFSSGGDGVGLWGVTGLDGTVLERVRGEFRASTDRTLGAISRVLGPAARELAASTCKAAQWWSQIFTDAIGFAGYAEPGSVAAGHLTTEQQEVVQRFLSCLRSTGGDPVRGIALNPIPLAVLDQFSASLDPETRRQSVMIEGIGPSLLSGLDDAVTLLAGWLNGANIFQVLPVWTNICDLGGAMRYNLTPEQFTKALEATVLMANPSPVKAAELSECAVLLMRCST